MVKSVRRALDIFESVATAQDGLSINELARQLGIPKSSAWNLAKTLLERRYLEQSPSGALLLGSRLFDVGVCARGDSRLLTVARPIMARLANATGETVFIGIMTPDFEVLELDKVVSEQIIRYDAEIGRTRPAHCTASGRCLLAYLPEAQLEYYLRTTRRQRFTSRTITSSAALKAELRKLRRAGVAVSVEERVPGATSVGAPVMSATGRSIAALSVSGPTFRMVANREAIIEQTKEAAMAISVDLGANGAIVRTAPRPLARGAQHASDETRQAPGAARGRVR